MVLRKKGEYTVKSGYRVAISLDERMQNIGSSSNTEEVEKFWKKIWSCKVPSKLKHFVWKAWNNVLSTKDNLLCRKLDVQITCHGCHKKSEDVLHAIWSCKRSMAVWRISQFSDWTNHQWNSFDEIVESATKSQQDKELGIFYIAWLVWRERNKALFGEQLLKPAELIDKAQSLFHELEFANGIQHTATPKVDPVAWSLPRPNGLKLNCDGATNLEDGRSGIGAILRNDNGQLVLAVVARGPKGCSAFLSELLSLREGPYACMQHGLYPTEVEMDCLEVISCINLRSWNWGLHRNVVYEIRNMCEMMQTKQIRYQPRSANGVAHELRLSILHHRLFGVRNGPPWLSAAIHVEMQL